MQRLIFISGYGGSGKTTCADLLEHELTSAARIEADETFRIKPFDAFGDKLGRIKMRNCCALIETFLDEEYDNIIVSGLVWSQAELDQVAAKFADRCEIILFWLQTTKEIRHARVLKRSRDRADSQEFLDQVEEQIPDPTPFRVPMSTRVHEIPTDQEAPDAIVTSLVKYLSA